MYTLKTQFNELPKTRKHIRNSGKLKINKFAAAYKNKTKKLERYSFY